MIKMPNEIKALFKQDNVQKNVRIHFPNGEHEDITNENLIEESMSFTESICSRENLKFGLCEASVFQIETVGIGNIKGCTIEVSVEIQTDSGFYPVPLGTFIVDSCIKQNRANRRYVLAYSETLADIERMSAVERAKRNTGIQRNTPYKFDFLSFVLSNIKGAYNNKELFTEEDLEITIENDFSYGFTYNASGLTTIYTGTCAILEIKGSDDIANKLLKFNYHKVADYGKQKRDFRQKNNGTDKVCGMHMSIFEFYAKGDAHYMPHEKVLQVDDSYMVYPYISGTPLDETYMIFYLPLTVEKWESYGIGERNLVDSWEFATGCDVKVCTLNPEIVTREISIERQLCWDDKYRVTQDESDCANMIASWLEMNACFGKVSRNGGILMESLQLGDVLYPKETLYPREDLFPSENVNIPKSHWLSVWYDDFQVKQYGKVSVKYLNSAGEYATYVYRFGSGENIYYFDDNYIFLNSVFTEDEIKSILDMYFIPKIEGLSYVPAEVTLKGRPDVEAGDCITVLTNEGGFDTFVMRRTMTGIKSLIDTFEASGIEVNIDTTDESLAEEGVI